MISEMEIWIFMDHTSFISLSENRNTELTGSLHKKPPFHEG